MICRCDACVGLRAECGVDLYPMYAKKLLIRGWVGVVTPAERAYVRVHRSEAQKAQAAVLGQRRRGLRPGTP